jgi:hypothetical protein
LPLEKCERNSLANIVFHDQPKVEAVVPAVVVYAYENFPTDLRLGWDGQCSRLLRRQPLFFPDQAEFRINLMDRANHAGHPVETISPVDTALWPFLDSPGRIGRLDRLAYESCRKMEPETFLRIAAKKQRLFRKKHLSSKDMRSDCPVCQDFLRYVFNELRETRFSKRSLFQGDSSK